jgi:hypothetical protein
MKGYNALNYLLQNEISQKTWILNIGAVEIPDVAFNPLYFGNGKKLWVLTFSFNRDDYP